MKLVGVAGMRRTINKRKDHKHSGTGTDDIRVMMMTIMIALYGSETQGCQNSVRTAVQFSSTLEFWCFAI